MTAISSHLLVQSPTVIQNDIYIYERQDYNTWFEDEYSTNAEPWDYSKRGGEMYRLHFTVKKLQQYMPANASLLELGCSKGMMTELLIPVCGSVYASDISLTAVKACQKRCNAIAARQGKHVNYLVTSTPGLPFADARMDVVTVCDGFAGWWFSEEKQQQALQDIHRILKTGGIAILTDYLTPDKFADYEAAIRKGPLNVAEVSFYYDKPWYLLESLIKKTSPGLFGGLRDSVTIAKMLHSLGSLAGRKAARHIFIVVRKD